MNAPRAGGFTLAEVLVAVMITAALAGIIYSSYMAGLRIILSAQKDMERTGMARLVLDRIAGDLSCAFFRPDREYMVFVGTEGGGEFPSSALTFIAANHERSERNAPESDLCETSYFLDPGANGERYLMRREDPTLDEDPFSGGDTSAVGEGIAAMTLEYFGEAGWTSSWDSRDNNAIPRGARITLVFITEEEGGAEEGEEAVRYTTYLTETAIPAGGNWEEEEEEVATPTPRPATSR